MSKCTRLYVCGPVSGRVKAEIAEIQAIKDENKAGEEA